MKRILKIGIDNIKIKIDVDEYIVYIFLSEYEDPITYPYDDVSNLINILEEYTTLYQIDIKRIIGVFYE